MKRFVIIACSVLAAFEVFAAAITTKDVEKAFSRDIIINSCEMSLCNRELYLDIERELLHNKELHDREIWIKIIIDSFDAFNAYLMIDTKESVRRKAGKIEDRSMLFSAMFGHVPQSAISKEMILLMADSLGRIVPRRVKARLWVDGENDEMWYDSKLREYRRWLFDRCAMLIKELRKTKGMDDKEVDSFIEEFCKRAKVTDAHEVKMFSYSVYDIRYVPTKAEREEAMKRKGWVK